MKAGRRKVIIACAVTGWAHTPSMSEFLPVTPDAIARDAIDAARAGAAILHLHARDPQTGCPVSDPAAFEGFVPRIVAESDAIISIATDGRPGTPVEARVAYPARHVPELCSVDMGPTAYTLRRAARGVPQWTHPWEEELVEGVEGRSGGNSLEDIKSILSRLGHGSECRFAFECHDPSHLHNLAHLAGEGLLQGPFFVQCNLRANGGLGPDPENVFMMRATADRLFGRDGYEFSVSGSGRHQIPLAAMAAILGGHVRVGLADSLVMGRGLPATSCAAQVLKIRRIVEDLSFEIASPDEAREILQTTGGRAAGGRKVALGG